MTTTDTRVSDGRTIDDEQLPAGSNPTAAATQPGGLPGSDSPDSDSPASNGAVSSGPAPNGPAPNGPAPNGPIGDGPVGDGIAARKGRWSFGDGTVEVFDDHVRKSVPLYAEGHALVVALSDFFLPQGSVCYELGTSTGVLVERLAHYHAGRDVHFIGIDVEPAMVDKAKQRCASLDNVEIIDNDLVTTVLGPADLVVSYYTLQFVPPRYRQRVIDGIYNALGPGGGLVLFEKVRAPDPRLEDMAQQLYADYKLAQGYSPTEILGKAHSIRGVLEPMTTNGNIDMLHRAGFETVNTVMKYGPPAVRVGVSGRVVVGSIRRG